MTLAKMGSEVDDFQSWLVPKLQELSVDESVFGSYIIGILESGDSTSEKLEALEEVLNDIVENGDIAQMCQEIIKQWTSKNDSVQAASVTKNVLDVDDRLVRIMEQQAQSIVTVKTYTEEEKQLKSRSWPSMGSQVSDGEVSESEDEHEVKEEAAPDLAKNTNLEDVLRLEKEKKEKLRQESHKKKEKDKEDREKQKKLQEERKDKEKKRTQKGEKRR